MTTDPKWRDAVQTDAERLEQAERDRPGLLRQTLYLGTLGLVFVLPLIAATYAGHWIDQRLPGYSVRGTLSGIFIGLALGATNVYLLTRERKP
ncbi:MAG TPA: AtpZ/AtpI family protein [Rhodanobacteraceae bacterium]|jgi:ATP synthase protein I|nr:AtpZ/AtpI family protein [Rhodanobacteraceae bacterium]